VSIPDAQTRSVVLTDARNAHGSAATALPLDFDRERKHPDTITTAESRRATIVTVSFDPAALRRLGGPKRRPERPATLGFLLRIGVAAGVAAALCGVVLLLTARAAGWDTTVDGTALQPFGVVGVCLVVGVLAALGTYVAARVTVRPEVWVTIAGALIFAASLPGLPPAVIALHSLAAVWIVGSLAWGVRGGSHLRG